MTERTPSLSSVAIPETRPADGEPAAFSHRLPVLDGVRAASILLVLACHLAPLGPSAWQINNCAGRVGMALFFTLSGFLIATTLERHPSVPAFLIRRLARIMPLAWLATLIYLTIQGRSLVDYVNTLLFLTNYRHQSITPLTSPFWSLCVEVHFYLAAALVTLAFGRRGLPLLAVVGLLVTALRVLTGTKVSIETHLRVDEILAGVSLALLCANRFGGVGKAALKGLSGIPIPLMILGLLAGGHPWCGAFQYLRPYLAAALVGRLLLDPGPLGPLLTSRPSRYIAEISYALYVIHSIARLEWFESASKLKLYLVLRPIAVALTFGLAHLSTFHMERPCIALGKRLSRRWEHPRTPLVAAAEAAI